MVDLVVTNPDGESVTLPAAFTYTAAPHTTTDTDLDGLPDAWETQFGLDPTSATGVNGADGDPDGDGMLNPRTNWPAARTRAAASSGTSPRARRPTSSDPRCPGQPVATRSRPRSVAVPEDATASR